MKLSNLFALRVLIALATLLYLLYFFLPYVYQNLFSEEVNYYLTHSPVEPIYQMSMKEYWVILSVHLVAFSALFFRVIFARYLYILIIILDFIVALVSGVTSYTGIDIIVLSLLYMVSALILYIDFCELSGVSWKEKEKEKQ